METKMLQILKTVLHLILITVFNLVPVADFAPA